MLGHIASIVWNLILLVLFLGVAVAVIAALFALAPVVTSLAALCWPIVALAVAALAVVMLAQ